MAQQLTTSAEQARGLRLDLSTHGTSQDGPSMEEAGTDRRIAGVIAASQAEKLKLQV